MNANRFPNGRLHSLIFNRLTFFSGLGIAALAVALAASSNGFAKPGQKAAAKTKPAQPGLRGLLPVEVPEDLVAEELESLGKGWTKWAADVSKNLGSLYEDDSLDASAQRKVIASLNTELNALKQGALRAKKTAVREQLTGTFGRLQRRLAIAKAALDTLSADPKTAQRAEIKAASARVTKAIAKLRAHLRSYQNGGVWLSYVRTAEMTKALKSGNTSAVVLAVVQKKIAAGTKLKVKAQREFLGQPAFVGLQTALAGLNAAANKPPKTVNMKALRSELKKMIAAIEMYEATESVAAASTVRSTFEKIQSLSADGGVTLADAMRSHYFNYNFRLYVSEEFLNRLINTKRTEKGVVNDYILGASVSGNQTTTASASIDLKPSRNNARFDLVLSGVTQSNTVGVTSQATIYTYGEHQFWARKEVRFDGDTFHADKPARIRVIANNQTTGATTKYSRMPILGGIADRVAFNAANKKRGESEAIARQKLSSRILPEFNDQISDSMKKANKEFQSRVLDSLKSAGLMPEARSVRTTNDYLLLSGRVMTSGELAGSLPNPTERPGRGLTIRFHESVLNNAFDKIKLAGRKMTSDEVQSELRKAISDFLGENYKLSKKASKKSKSGDKFIFDSTDPIRFRVRNGSLNIVIRCGLERAGKKPIPPQIITVPLKFNIVGDKLAIERGTIAVAPATTPKNRAEQIVRAGVMRKKLASAIPTDQRKRTITFKQEGKKPLVVSITKISSVNGWMTVWAE